MNDPKTIEYRLADFVESVLPRATLQDLSAEAFVDAIAGEMMSGARPDLIELAEELGAPVRDSLCTVTSARAMIMAAGRGRAFYQHELRGRLPMPPDLQPELEVWEEGTVPVWHDGVFVEPKYFSFRQDAPFAAYNPVHRRKWRPHELLHGAVGFFWRDDASRFEHYIGARANELLPVVHWYGLDEIFRPRCQEHESTVLHREFCPACEAAVRPYWEVEPADREAAIDFTKSAQEHFVRELDAIRREIATGQVVETPDGRLNASTDSVGYVYGHINRVNSWSFRVWVELFLRDGFDYFSDIETYVDRVEACAARLVGSAVVTNFDRFQALRQRRILQDVGYRALLAMEWLDRDSPAGRAVERTVVGALERCSEAVDTLVDRDEAQWEADDALNTLVEVLGEVRDELPDEVAEPLMALGLSFYENGRDPDWELANLAEGISQTARLTAAKLDASHVQKFADSTFFGETGRLITRFGSYLRDKAENNPRYIGIADLASLEAWAADDPRRDEHAERFGQEVFDLEDLHLEDLRLNSTFRRADFGVRAVSELADATFDTERVELAAAYFQGELHVLVLDDALREALDAVLAGELPEDLDALYALLESNLVVWSPGVRRVAIADESEGEESD